MIKSMTGFGRCEASDEFRKVTVEIRSVNHRYLDLSVKVPRRMSAFEIPIRNYIKKHVYRGKVDVFVSFEDHSDSLKTLHYNETLAKSYVDYFKQMEQELGVKYDGSAVQLGMMPDVFEMENVTDDDSALSALLDEALEGAVKAFCNMREAEGAALVNDLIGKLDEMEGYVRRIEEVYPQVVEAYRTKLYEKVKELVEDTTIEESRLAAEVVLYADKICVDEETVRLHSHIAGMKQCFHNSETIGKKLDFIAQEMNRESNTILSKSTNVDIADIAIELKTDVEKVREQVQNIE